MLREPVYLSVITLESFIGLEINIMMSAFLELQVAFHSLTAVIMDHIVFSRPDGLECETFSGADSHFVEKNTLLDKTFTSQMLW